MSKRLGGIKGCKYKTSSWHINGFPMEITLGQQYNVGEKPTVILYTYNNRHAGTPEKTVKTKQRQCSTPPHMVVMIYCKELSLSAHAIPLKSFWVCSGDEAMIYLGYNPRAIHRQ